MRIRSINGGTYAISVSVKLINLHDVLGYIKKQILPFYSYAIEHGFHGIYSDY